MSGQPVDEVERLRERLEGGDWGWLTHPLLTLMLWQDPAADWWPAAAVRCLDTISRDVPALSPAEEDAWGTRWITALWPEDEDRREQFHPAPYAVDLAWTRARLDAAGEGHADHRAALAILERLAPR